MAINNGSYLAFTVPQQAAGYGYMQRKAQGDVYVVDLGMLNEWGDVPSNAMVCIDQGILGNNAYAPRYISADTDDGQFITHQ